MRRSLVTSCAVAVAACVAAAGAEPLRLAQGRGPLRLAEQGSALLETAAGLGWLAEAGLEVDWVPASGDAGIDAFAAGQVDACFMTVGDALVLAETSGAPSVAVALAATSRGADALIALPEAGSLARLRGKRVGVEVGFQSHRLLLAALQVAGFGPQDVELVNVPPSDMAEALAERVVHAVVAGPPVKDRVLEGVPGSAVLFTSARAPFSVWLFVDPESLATRRGDWTRFVALWNRVLGHATELSSPEEASGGPPEPAAQTGASPLSAASLATPGGDPGVPFDQALARAHALNVGAGLYPAGEPAGVRLDPELAGPLPVSPAGSTDRGD